MPHPLMLLGSVHNGHMPRPAAPPIKKRSGEQSPISSSHSPLFCPSLLLLSFTQPIHPPPHPTSLPPPSMSPSDPKTGMQHKMPHPLLLGSVHSQLYNGHMPRPHAPPSKKRSGEQSPISWAYSQKGVRTNEITRWVIIT